MSEVGGGGAGAQAIGGGDEGGAGGGAGSGQGSGASWRDALPEGIRADASLANFADIGALAQGYIETKRVATARQPDFKTADGLKLFADAVRPADAAAYDIPTRDDSGKPMADAFRAFAHTTGMPGEWAKATAEFFNGQMDAAITAATAASEKEVSDFKTQMGATAFDGRMDAVRRMLPQLGVELDDERLTDLDKTLGSKNLLAMMFGLADRFGDPAPIEDAKGAGGHGALTPEQAQERRSVASKDPNWRKQALIKGTPENKEAERLNGIIASGRNRKPA